MKKILSFSIILLVFFISCKSGNKTNSNPDKMTVAAYYFASYHTDDSRNIINKGSGWSEWELVKAAQPRFPGHHQPNVPAWGYTDEKDWDKAKTEYGVPYFPDVTMGWDPRPRCDLKSEWANVGYPFMNTIGNNTPENFKKAFQLTKDKLLKDPKGPQIMNINCWNEWTEGSYLEPDMKNGIKYLEAVKKVFGKINK